jgi:hypothetical protein
VTIEQDRNVLAGEYVLGTLDSYAQAEAQALMALDPEFAAIVRAWERRLGELSAMVSPVEPPNKTWDRIKSEIAKIEAERAALAGPEKLAPTPEPEKPALDPPGATVERTVTPAVPAPERSRPRPPRMRWPQPGRSCPQWLPMRQSSPRRRRRQPPVRPGPSRLRTRMCFAGASAAGARQRWLRP